MRFALIAAAMALAGCSGTQAAKVANTTGVGYFKDARTGLCFAAVKSVSYGLNYITSIAAVPCSPEVEKLVAK